MWFLANWRLCVLGGAILAAFGMGMHIRGLWDESTLKSALAEQQTTLLAQYADDKRLTEENSRAYQSKISALTRKLADAKRVFPSRCIMPITSPSGSLNGETAGNKLSGQNGVTSDALLDFSADCERLRLQIISMQEFEDQVWKTH